MVGFLFALPSSKKRQQLKQGIISSPIQEIFPIDKAKEAVKLANQEGRSGKIIIDLQ